MSVLTTAQEMDSARNFYRDQKLPKRALKIKDAATAELEKSAAASHALQPGDIAPDSILPDVDGRCVRLYSELERGPVVLVFYRGGWCPYCKIHLRGFQKSLADYKRGGAQVMGISPQLPDHSLVTRENSHLEFLVLSDVGLHTARAFGVAFELPKALSRWKKTFSSASRCWSQALLGVGFSLEKSNGVEGAKGLPMPATFVIRTDRTIAYAHVEADYTRRSEPLEVLNHVRELENVTA